MIHARSIPAARVQTRAARSKPTGVAFRPRSVAVMAAVNTDQLKAAKVELKEVITSKSSNPIIVRLAWHDSGTYNKNITDWPACGGANASIRFKPEINHGCNAGLQNAIDIIEPVKAKFPGVTYSDLFQMASAVAIELAGGPKIPMRYGRKDATAPEQTLALQRATYQDASTPEQCATEGYLPGGGGPFDDGSASPGDHLRKIFYRMGLGDKEIVALSGGHTLGRSRPDRSGWGKAETKYTKDGPGNPGGQSWTPDWLVFNNSYYTVTKAQDDDELLVMPTDNAIFADEAFRPYAEKYAADEAAFFTDYTAAHLKLSELGVEWQEGGPVTGL
eukprot:gene19266-25903_t